MNTLLPKTPFNRACFLLAIAMGAVSPACALSIATNSPMLTARYEHTATLLTDGRVLVAGGWDVTNLSSAELRDTTGKWTTTGSMTTNRINHTATLLQNGNVLVAGGYANAAPYYLSTAELYDPRTGTWTNTGSMKIPHVFHTATLLADGTVLVTGGTTSNAITAVAELYDPATETWTLTGTMTSARWFHTATLMPDAKVLVAGGDDNNAASAEIYDPTNRFWSPTQAMTTNRESHTATLLPNGQVLVAGGSTADLIHGGLVSLGTSELFNPTNGIWTPTSNDLSVARASHSATLLPSGRVLVAGGFLTGPGEIPSVELFDPATNGWSLLTNQLNYARWGHTATLLASGQTFFAGGVGSGGDLSSTEAFDSDNITSLPTRSMRIPAMDHTATLLINGNVLVTGGSTTNLGVNATTTMYNPFSEFWVDLTMPSRRYGHTATLLADGRVLIAGGVDSIFPSQPATNTAAVCNFGGTFWTATGSMSTGRVGHTATLLLSGKVLVAGGAPGPCEIYDPASGIWTKTGPLNITRGAHTATLLADGKVLVAGGYGTSLGGPLYPKSELYDPATGVWTTNAARTTYLSGHTATLLPNGKVLIVFGYQTMMGATIDGTSIYDPATGTWAGTPGPNVARYHHTATLLPNGKVLVVGGHSDQYGDLNDAESYDPTTGIWTTVGSMIYSRSHHTATLLSTGRLLITGGEPGPVETAELYDIGLGFDSLWQSHIFPLSLDLGTNTVFTGVNLRGISEASGGNSQNSASDHPVVQLRSIDSGRTLFLSATNWSAADFNGGPLFNFPPGYALLTVFVNGVPGPANFVTRVRLPVPTAPTVANATKLPNGSFQFMFTNSPGAVFGTLATTNPALPLSNWTAISGITEISPGQFQFIDPQSTNGRRFYRVRAL